jgi:hypothetical protein
MPPWPPLPPWKQVKDLRDQDRVSGAVPGVALVQAGCGVKQKHRQRAVGSGQTSARSAARPAAAGSPSASRAFASSMKA